MAATRKWAVVRGLLSTVAVIAIVAAAVLWVLPRLEEGNKVTAYFTAAVGVYPESDVRVLGVKVGTVDSVEPQGATVEVSMTLEPGIPIPAGAVAVVIAPSLVSDRYVQLAPAYSSGPVLAENAIIPVSSTLVPVELDELFTSLDKLNIALGPDGANKAGALSDFISSGATFLDGNGKELNDMLKALGQSARTLSGSQDHLFDSVDNIQKITTMLATNDEMVGKFNDQLAQVSQYLAEERETFGGAMHELAGALSQVETFIKDNRGKVKVSLDKLQGTAQLLADQRAALAEAFDTAPLALTNVMNAYDPATGTIDGRGNLTEFSSANPVLPLVGQ